MRLALLFGSLTLAFLLAVWTTQAPKPRPAGASAVAFSAARASRLTEAGDSGPACSLT